ncbi:MAG: formylglycine-generating enzyme family protein [Prevotella sp.]
MIPVEGGTFTMGATAEQENPYEDEKPHQVTLSGYYIGKYEVTQALWKAVMGKNPSKQKGDNLPVERVSWNDCQEFISRLNSITGKTFRLPTEAEWEFAARGGNLSRGYQYSGSNNINDVAWFESNSDQKTHNVGTKAPNELGIYDMSGNVWEWCQDWYGETDNTPQINPTGPSSGTSCVTRGGCWLNGDGRCRVAYRGDVKADSSNIYLGLRLAISLKDIHPVESLF